MDRPQPSRHAPRHRVVAIAVILSAVLPVCMVVRAPGALAEEQAIAGPVTVKARILLPADARAAALEAAVLAGLGDAAGAFPAALALMWAEDRSGWFPTWSLQLHSDRGLLPAGLAARESASYGTRFATLASPPLQWGYEYETTLSYEPGLGVLSVLVTDAASGAAVYRGNFTLPPASEPLHPNAGWLHKGDGTAPARFVPTAAVSRRGFVPAGAEWALVETLGGVPRPVPLSRIERDRVESVQLRLDPPPSPGSYAFFAESDGFRIPLGSVDRPAGTVHLPVPLAALPVGAVRFVMEYSEGGTLLLADSKEIPVGRVDAAFGEVVVGPGGAVRVSLALGGDGQLPALKIGVEAEIAELAWDESSRSYVERPQGAFVLADALTPAEGPHAVEIALPEFLGEGGIWKVRFRVRTDAGSAVNLLGEEKVVNAVPDPPGAGLKVMSFNVRRPTPDDGPNAWQFREDLVYRVIRELDPDIVGVQEPWEFQLWALDRALPEYASIVVQVHPDGLVHNAIYYRKDRLELLDEGRFWLSETPATWRTPSGERPRAVVWGLFRAIESGKRFYVLNTHYRDGQDAARDRVLSSRVIRDFIGTLEPGVPVILTGDFNAAPGSEEYRLLTAGEAAPFFDARTTAAMVSGPEGTHHGFTGRPSGSRIDWILLRGRLQPLELHHVALHDGDRYPSDHLPVFAVLRLL